MVKLCATYIVTLCILTTPTHSFLIPPSHNLLFEDLKIVLEIFEIFRDLPWKFRDVFENSVWIRLLVTPPELIIPLIISLKISSPPVTWSKQRFGSTLYRVCSCSKSTHQHYLPCLYNCACLCQIKTWFSKYRNTNKFFSISSFTCKLNNLENFQKISN